MAEIKKPEETAKKTDALAVNVSTKAAASKAEEKKAETPAPASAKKEGTAAAPKVEKKSAGRTKKNTEKKPAEKKAAPQKEEKKEPEKEVGKPRGRQGGRRSAKNEVIHIQLDGKDYTRDQLLQSARDIWVYDLGRKLSEFNSIELYINVNESKAYYVINEEVTGNFDI